MKRKDVMTQLIQDFQDNLHPANGYKTQPNKIYRGYYQWDDVTQTPALAVTLISDDLVDNLMDSSEGLRKLTIQVYGYGKTDGFGDVSEIQDLLNDVEAFLFSTTHFTYSNNMNQIISIQIYEGGLTDPANIFLLTFTILYVNE